MQVPIMRSPLSFSGSQLHSRAQNTQMSCDFTPFFFFFRQSSFFSALVCAILHSFLEFRFNSLIDDDWELVFLFCLLLVILCPAVAFISHLDLSTVNDFVSEFYVCVRVSTVTLVHFVPFVWLHFIQ